jgi:hypothetical protein
MPRRWLQGSAQGSECAIETCYNWTYFRVVSTFDLPPLQGESLWRRFPGFKPWAESSSPFGALSG